MKVKCYECGREVEVKDAKLIKSGFKEAFELEEELDTEYKKDNPLTLEEIGDFYICKQCNEALGGVIFKVMENLEEKEK